MATGYLGLPPSEFWRMTGPELDAMCGAKLRATPGYVAPIDEDEAESLLTLHQRLEAARGQ